MDRSQTEYNHESPLSKDQEIVFFDSLGYGWVVDKKTVFELFAGNSSVIQKSENDLMDNLVKAYPSI